MVEVPSRKEQNIALLFQLAADFADELPHQSLMLAIDEHGSTERDPLADDRPAFDFPLEKKAREQAAKHNAIHIAHVIGDDHITAALQMAFIPRTVILMFKIMRIKRIKLRLSRLIIFQRFGIRSTLIQT